MQANVIPKTRTAAIQVIHSYKRPDANCLNVKQKRWLLTGNHNQIQGQCRQRGLFNSVPFRPFHSAESVKLQKYVLFQHEGLVILMSSVKCLNPS